MKRVSFPIVLFLISAALQAQEEPLRVGGDIRPPMKTFDTPPTFPAEAKLFGIEGLVILETSIEKDGSVGDVRVLRSIPLLDWGAVSTVRKWRYEPTLLNGEPVPIVMTVTVNYSLGDSSTETRRLGRLLLQGLQEGKGSDVIKWPTREEDAELSDYRMESGENGARDYFGRITNVTNEALSGLRAVVVHRETFEAEGQEREALVPVIQEIGTLEGRASVDFALHVPNDGSRRLEKVVLLLTKEMDDGVHVLVGLRARRDALGS